jgi:hypothetical protein
MASEISRRDVMQRAVLGSMLVAAVGLIAIAHLDPLTVLLDRLMRTQSIRATALWVLIAIGTAVYLAMLVTLARSTTHAAKSVKSAVLEFFFTLVPWFIFIACAAPAVRAVLARG